MSDHCSGRGTRFVHDSCFICMIFVSIAATALAPFWVFWRWILCLGRASFVRSHVCFYYKHICTCTWTCTYIYKHKTFALNTVTVTVTVPALARQKDTSARHLSRSVSQKPCKQPIYMYEITHIHIHTQTDDDQRRRLEAAAWSVRASSHSPTPRVGARHQLGRVPKIRLWKCACLDTACASLYLPAINKRSWRYFPAIKMQLGLSSRHTVRAWKYLPAMRLMMKWKNVAFTRVSLHACLYLMECVILKTCIYLCMYTYMYMCVCMYVYTYIYLYVYIPVCIYIYVCIYIHMYI
jgi:hypothetical protein